MKNSLSTAAWIVLLMVIFSCSADDINLTCPDPLGSDTKTIQTYTLSCFQPDFDGCFEFRLNESAAYIQSIYVPYPDPDPTEAPVMIDIGPVTCLSEVTQRPETGWKYTVIIRERHGYVFKMKDGSLGRLFINSWETSGEEVTKVIFTRQYPY